VEGEQEKRKPQAPLPPAECPKIGTQNASPAPVRTKATSPAATTRKAPRRGSGTTATTSKSIKTNKTGNSNSTNKTKSSKVTSKTNISTTSKMKGPPLPLKHSQPMSVSAIPQQTAASWPVASDPLAPTGATVSVVKKPSPSRQIQRNKPVTGQRLGLDGRTSPPNQNHIFDAPPKPPSFTAAGATTNTKASPTYSLLSNKRKSCATTAQQPKPVLRAPSRPTSMITDSATNNIPNRLPASGESPSPKSKCGGPHKKAKSLPYTSTPTSTALVLRQPDRFNSAAQQQPTRTKSLDLEDLAATESDSSGGSGNPSDIATINPLRVIYNRTRSMMDDLMGSGNSFHDEPTTTNVPLNDSAGGALPPPSTNRGLIKQSKCLSNQGSDHQRLGRSSYHRQKSLPPPPNRGASFLPGLGGGSLHGGSSHSVDFLSSASSFLTKAISDEPPFVNDPAWKKPLRFLRLLPPSPKERRINRKIRILLWASLVMDLICAVVAIASFTEVTTCCGKPIWGLGGSASWSTAMTVVSYVYIVGIFMEIIPVVRETGIPWNLLNPIFGFLLTFAVFFDDSRTEAISMWVLEIIAIVLDVLVYRAKRQKRMDKEILLDSINQKLEPFFASNRKANGTTTRLAAIDTSFHETAITAMEEETVADHREIKLLRDRRHLRHSLAEDQKHLNYHLIGVIFNTGLIFVTLIFIVAIASTGGMCVYDSNTPNPFWRDQLGLCSACQGVEGTCQICRSDGTSQCYYPY
jgi:hypothetical protein